MYSRALLLTRRGALVLPHTAPLPAPPRRCLSSHSSTSSVSASTPFTSCGPPPAALLPLLSGYGACVSFPVHWGDMDTFQHVNNVTFVRYVESGRIAALLDMAATRVDGVSEVELQRAVSSFVSGRGVGVILKSVSVKYRRPAAYPDMLTVGSALTQLQADRFTLSHVVVSAKQRAVVAEASGTLVCFDYKNQTKTALPSIVHTAIAAWGRAYAGRADEHNNIKQQQAVP